jgi:tripartite-type tricarboxylate transporter receptor subunit TctC
MTPRPPARRRRLLVALCAAPLAAPGALRAQASAEPVAAWPSRPVKLIVPFAPGGPTDTVARLLAERLQAIWKQSVLVDYKPGAGTVLGTQAVAGAPGDGYTLGMAISAHMVNPSLIAKLPYDTLKDLSGVSQLALAHFGLFAHPSVPVSNVAELIAYAKKHPGTLSYATPGIGTGTHLAGEMLNQMAGLDLVHVPYKGSAPAQQDVIGGRVPLLFDVLFSSMPFVRDGRLKVLALSSPRRSETQPDIPLIAESVPGFSAMSIIGVIAPSGVPRELLRRIGADVGAAVRSPELRERFVALGMEPVGSTPEAYDALIRTEIDKWAGVVRQRGIRLD